ncbi:hypothetical protein GF319_09420 [Candidatus Bathyarchaeota archaeon]|nr:hypothetical protein [Candidatus Bathyarchaeota archaeon]
MSYSTATDVRKIIHTSLADSEITDIIQNTDAQINKRIGPQSTSDKVIKKLSVLMTSITIKGRQPETVSIGEYKESLGNSIGIWQREVAEIYRLYEPFVMASSGYNFIEEEKRYTEESS